MGALSDYELRILRAVAGLERAEWGAATGQALEVLQRRGLIRIERPEPTQWCWTITREGRQELEWMENAPVS